MLLLKRRFSLVEKIILIGFVAFAVFIVGYWLTMKRPNKDFYVPQNLTGWVTIYYGVPNAPALPVEKGVWQVKIPASGRLETSTVFEDGWSRDRFFRYDSAGNKTEIPRSLNENGTLKKWIFWYESHFVNFSKLGSQLSPNQDTLLYEGTRLYKDNMGNLQYSEGKKSLEAFYLSAKPLDIVHNPPPLADSLVYVPRLKKVLTNSEVKR